MSRHAHSSNWIMMAMAIVLYTGKEWYRLRKITRQVAVSWWIRHFNVHEKASLQIREPLSTIYTRWHFLPALIVWAWAKIHDEAELENAARSYLRAVIALFALVAGPRAEIMRFHGSKGRPWVGLASAACGARSWSLRKSKATGKWEPLHLERNDMNQVLARAAGRPWKGPFETTSDIVMSALGQRHRCGLTQTESRTLWRHIQKSDRLGDIVGWLDGYKLQRRGARQWATLELRRHTGGTACILSQGIGIHTTAPLFARTFDFETRRFDYLALDSGDADDKMGGSCEVDERRRRIVATPPPGKTPHPNAWPSGRGWIDLPPGDLLYSVRFDRTGAHIVHSAGGAGGESTGEDPPTAGDPPVGGDGRPVDLERVRANGKRIAMLAEKGPTPAHLAKIRGRVDALNRLLGAA